jgi:hypothetical protein
MGIAPTEEFWQWLMARKAEIERGMIRAGDKADETHIRMLLKTERAELDVVISFYDRIVMKRVAAKAD